MPASRFSSSSLMLRPPPTSTLFPYTTLFRSKVKIISVTFRRVIRTNHKKASKIWRLFYGSFRSEERFSRNAETDLVCRLLLEKKKTKGDFFCACHQGCTAR